LSSFRTHLSSHSLSNKKMKQLLNINANKNSKIKTREVSTKKSVKSNKG
jgi:predicted transglutaminase-like cysteine proteinase